MILDGNGRVPVRLKFGLNLGSPGIKDVPSNICFNARVPNSKILGKPGTFKWSPIMIEGETMVVIDNDSFERDYDKKANLQISIWNQDGNTPYDFQVEIEPHGSYWFNYKKFA